MSFSKPRFNDQSSPAKNAPITTEAAITRMEYRNVSLRDGQVTFSSSSLDSRAYCTANLSGLVIPMYFKKPLRAFRQQIYSNGVFLSKGDGSTGKRLYSCENIGGMIRVSMS